MLKIIHRSHISIQHIADLSPTALPRPASQAMSLANLSGSLASTWHVHERERHRERRHARLMSLPIFHLLPSWWAGHKIMSDKKSSVCC